MPLTPPPTLPTPRQLALPLDASASASPHALAVAGAPVAPRRVWRSLPAALRHQVQQELLRICQEVSHDAAAER